MNQQQNNFEEQERLNSYHQIDNNNIQFEDSRITKIIMARFKIIETIRLQLIIVISILWFLEVDDQLNISEQDSNLLLWLTFSLNFILIGFTFFSYNILLKYWKETLIIQKDLSFWNSDQIYPCFFEIFILLITPTPFTQNYKILFHNNQYYYTLNELFIFVSSTRFIIILMIYIRICKFYNSQTQRLSQNFGIRMNSSFIFKYLIQQEPTNMIITLFIVTFTYCTCSMFIAEKAIQRNNLRTLILFKHSFMEVTFSLLAYAYEDYVPFTNLGRFVLAYSQYAGFVLVSILISAIIQSFEQDYGEFQATVLLDKLILKEMLQKTTSSIGEQFYYIMKYELNPFTDKRVLIIQEQLKKFKQLYRNYKSIELENLENLYKRKVKDGIYLFQDIQNYYKQQKYQSEQIHEMVNELISLKNYHYRNWVD